MRDYSRKLLVLVVAFCALFTGMVRAENLTQEFTHQLLVNQPPQSWEHRIDLPDQYAQKGLVFTKRTLSLLGRLVIETELFTPTFYYVKVRLPKHLAEPAKGMLNVALEIGNQGSALPVLNPPTELALMKGCASRKPIFIWKGEGKYSAITLLDATTGQTLWERVIVAYKGAEFDEGFLPIGHHYKWAVKQADESGKFSREAQAGFRIEQQGDSVVAIPE